MSQPVWDGKLEITARRTVKKGEEIFASFGPRTNDNLFLYYGTVYSSFLWYSLMNSSQVFQFFNRVD